VRTFGDTGAILGLVFLGFFEDMLPNSSGPVAAAAAATALPLK
jgi:hypothetical protein